MKKQKTRGNYKEERGVPVEHADEFLMKPHKSFKRKQALWPVEDLLDTGLITPKDVIRIAIMRGFTAKDIARYLINRGRLRICPKCGYPIEEVKV